MSLILNGEESHIPCSSYKAALARPTPNRFSPRQVFTLGVPGWASETAGFSLAEPVESGKWAALIGRFQHPPGS